MKTQFTLWQKVANTPPIALLVLFVWLLAPSNVWGDVTDVTWDSNSGKEFPSSSYNTKSGITLTTNWNTQSGLGVRSCGNGPVFNFENAPTDNYIDITTDGKALKTVYVSITHGGGEINDVSIAFSAADTYDGTNLATPSIITVYYDNGYYTGCNEACEITAPTGAKSARIHRAASGWGPYLHRIRVIAQDPSATPSCALSLGVTDKTVQAGESFSLNVSTAAGYDGEISYSVSPAGMVTLDNGTVTAGSTNGLAVITVTASTTENYEGDTKKCFVHVNNFAGTLTASEDAGTVTLDWFYNLPISLATEGTPINNGGSYTTTYADGIRYFTYTLSNNAENKYFGACDFKTPNVPNCKSFSFEYRGENNGTNPRVVPYAWLDGGAPNSGNIVANPVEIRSTWDEVTVIPSCNYYAGAANINNGAIDGLNFASYPVGCVAFFPMADGDVSGGTLQLRNAYFQIINSNSLTSSVKLVRKDGSAPANASDGTAIYTDAPSTYEDNSGLVAGHTYYYRVFVTYNTVVYASNAVSITMPGTAKEDPELSLPASSAVLKVGDTYTLEPTVASGYDGTLAYEITAGSDKISLSGTTITAEAAGTATVRVTAPETTEYNQVTANFTVTVLAVPETNLAITNVDGDNVTLSWTIPGIIDLRTARTERSSSFATNYSGVSNTTSSALINNGAELAVTYSANGGGSYNGFFFDVDLTSIESVSFDYKGENLGGGWKGILPGIYDGSTLYWESSKGLFGLAETSWTPITIAPSNGLWKSGTYSSGDISELCFLVYAEGNPVSGHVYLRNLRYHCTGMTDIDHIVIRRTTSAPATSITDGDEIYSGKMSHFVDTDSKAAGLYYYTLFAVYENGSIPVESVTLDTRVFNITYKDKGDAEFSGTHETGYPTTHSNAAATALKKATKEDYIFVGWYDNAACTGDAVTSLAAGAYDADITLYARWEQLSLHQPGKYQAPDGYGRVLKNVNGHDYEVYMVTFDTVETVHYGALYAGPVAKISDGYRMFRTSSDINTSSTSLGDGWVEFKPYKYGGGDSSGSIDEFKKLDGSGNIHSARYARISSAHYVRLYVQGYVEFAFFGRDKNTTDDYFEVRVDGVKQDEYTPSELQHVTRFTLTSTEPHFIEISANSTASKENSFYGFSLQLPDVERYTVTVAKNDNSYGTVSAASIANVRTGEATYVSDNTLYIAGTTVTATPAAATAEYTYAFDNWSGVPATITEATTVTANFTRTGNDYTLTWDLNGGTVTTAGTGAEMDATGTPSSPVAYGTAITAPVVEKAGCEFLGWDATPAATMPAENITYTAQWFTPEHISSAGTTTLNHANVRTVVNNTNPHNPIVSFDADNNGEAETCLNLEGPGSATWKAYITRGYYQARVIYGTTSGGVNIKLQVIDPETSDVVVETGEDKHTESGVKHCLAIWGLDLRGNDIDENKVYEIKVVDVHGAGSKPYISSVNITPMAIPNITSTAVTHLDYTNVIDPNKISILDLDQDSNIDTCLLIGGNKHTDWRVTLKNKGKYFVRVMYGKESGGTTLRLHVFDKNGNNVFTHPEDRSLSSSVRYETWTWSNVDLSDCTENEEYIIRIEDSYNGTGSKPNIVYLEIKSETVIIPAETRLYAENSISTLNFATDLDIDDDGNNDKLMNLKKNKGNAEWMVKITPGIYNVSLVYGVPAYGVKASVVLIDPSAEDPEDDRFLSTDPYYYHAAVKVGDVQQPHHYTETTLCDLSRITANKTYKVRVQDEWDDDNGCNLRVSHVLFTPIEPLQIPEETRLDASNVNVAPVIDGGRIDISNQKEAVWYAKMTPGIYNIALHYGVTKSNCTKVRFGIVDPATSDTIFRHQEDQCSSDVQTYTIEANNQDLRSSLDAEKVYKIFVKDNYKENGSEPQIDYLEFIRPSVIHTRSGLRIGDYGTICLPYAVAAADRTGAELFEIESWAENGTSMTMTQLNADEPMTAGRPYIFQATANTATFSYYADGDETPAGTHNGLIGSYVEAQIQENDNNYIIYNNKLYLVNAPARVGAYRAYIHRGGEYSPAPANRRRVTMGLYGTQTTTDINQISTEQITNKVIRNGHLFILRGDKIYNAQGQLVQ